MAKESEKLNSYNIICTGTIVSGEFHTPGNIRIDGTFDGSISTKGRIIVGPGGKVSGKIACQNGEFEGEINAVVEVEQHLALKATTTVTGDIHTDKLSIETGAVFHGHCKMKPREAENSSKKDKK
ncbi:MAG: polymer-forming cytoskeletal protein [Bacteroidales bacterium]|nr:polymer-forming cytoskeletal protein [Bacteroidales bacterium]